MNLTAFSKITRKKSQANFQAYYLGAFRHGAESGFPINRLAQLIRQKLKNALVDIQRMVKGTNIYTFLLRSSAMHGIKSRGGIYIRILLAVHLITDTLNFVL